MKKMGKIPTIWEFKANLWEFRLGEKKIPTPKLGIEGRDRQPEFPRADPGILRNLQLPHPWNCWDNLG